MEEVQEEPVVEEQAPVVDPETEKRAKMMGWQPKEKYPGPPFKWLPAEEYVSRAEELMPIMKGQLRKYEDTISSLQTELGTTRKTMEKVVKMSEKVAQREYEKAKNDLIKAQAEAVAAGNTSEWARLEGEKDKLEPPEKVEVPQAQAQNMQGEANPVFKQWHVDNDWYLSDPAMTRYANAFAAENQNPGIPYIQWLNMVKEGVKEAFPHKFDNPNRNKAASVDGGANRGASTGRPKSKTYNDLPADAKMQCDKYVNQKLMTKEKYIQEYFEEA
jgi:hypothetical protein